LQLLVGHQVRNNFQDEPIILAIPRGGVIVAENIESVQRFYMVISPDNSENYRLFLLGQKQLPEIVEG
jgi:hypothetical protein